MKSLDDVFRSNGLLAKLGLVALLCLLVGIVPKDALAWDAGTAGRAHDAAPSTGGENRISILDTRPKWAESTSLSSSREADCPVGYKYTLGTCFRDLQSLDAPSRDAICPSGYTFWLSFCQPSSYYAPSVLADCPPGYGNTLTTCYRGPDTKSLVVYRATCSGTNIGLICFRGSFSCPRGGSQAAGFCTQSCPSGYNYTGVSCLRPADTLSLNRATCKGGYNRSGALCNPVCAAGYSFKADYCQAAGDPIALTDARVTCPGGYNKNAIGRCAKVCPAGYTNTGETCAQAPDSRGESSMSCYATEVLTTIAGIPRCYSTPICPTGYARYGLLCQRTAVATGLGASVERTAISTLEHSVKQSGNTHLWVVNQALDLLQKEDPLGQTPLGAFVKELRTSATIRQQWEQGLWDADLPAYADADDHQGTHFYNPARKLRDGGFTPFDTYYTPKFVNKFDCKNAWACAAAQLKNVASYRLSDTNPQTQMTAAYHLGLALHYMTDITQPMHTSGWSGFDVPTNGHPQWEYYVPQIQHKFTVNGQTRNLRFLDWQAQGANLDDPSIVLHRAALRSNGFAPRLAAALNVDGGAGIVTIPGFNGIGLYTGYNFYNDQAVDTLTGEILQEAYQSTAAYLAAVWKTYFQVALRRTCDVDGNGIIDRLDLNAIMAARNTPASGATDARDADGNGNIDANDARQCALRCTYANCASANR